jgi:hypothetical protein
MQCHVMDCDLNSSREFASMLACKTIFLVHPFFVVPRWV